MFLVEYLKLCIRLQCLTDRSRLFHMSSDPSTMHPRQHYTRSVIRSGSNWLHSGKSTQPHPLILFLRWAEGFLASAFTLAVGVTRKLITCSVNVTTIVTGGVQSRIARTQRTLAPGSLYTSIEDEYTRRVSHSQYNAMPHEAYARSVVAQVLYGSAPWRWLWPWAQGRKTWIWEGHRSWLIWFLSGGWAWNGLFGRIMTRMFNLWKIKA